MISFEQHVEANDEVFRFHSIRMAELSKLLTIQKADIESLRQKIIILEQLLNEHLISDKRY